MQTYSLPKTRSSRTRWSRPKHLVVCAALAALSAHALPAQTLARPGWAGSGLTAESWWRNAVMYRITTRSFQDSNGDGIGDLAGVAQRMDYLQSLNVDAILLDPPGENSGFDEVISAAVPRHIRVIITLEDGGNTQQVPDSEVLAQARMWLTRGAAGIFLHSTRSATDVAPLLHRMRMLTDSFPGGRVILEETGTNPAPGAIHAINFDETAPPPPSKLKKPVKELAGAHLTGVPLELTNATAATIRSALNGLNNSPAMSSLFLTEQMYSTSEILAPQNLAALDGRRRMFALILLASRGAASLRYGQEIGLLPTESNSSPDPLMQWTKSNIAPVEKPVETAVAKPVVSDGFETYHPYVPPPKAALPAPALPNAEPGGMAPAVDPESLPGFTTGTLPRTSPNTPALDTADTNVAHEDADPRSLLNLYRRLIVLHHDNQTLRNGSETLLDYDGLDAVVWLRQPPHGSNAPAIIAVCNMSNAPLRVSLNRDLIAQHLRTGSVRNLLNTTASADSVQSTDTFSLPPYGIFLGELYH
jgi:hypothetical protein